MKVLVTGAAGSIGSVLVPELEKLGHGVYPTDIDTLDVTKPEECYGRILGFGPDVIYHLAADKHAPAGEEHPGETARINLGGTENILAAADGAKVILASTCKAADPETAYGASKLIAERLVLNAGGVVVRYFNVRETQGNVFRIWEQIPESDPIPWTDCWRYFVSIDEAVWLTVEAMSLLPGRYAPDPGKPVHMQDVAKALYPDRKLVEVPRRRGDRAREPLHAVCESVSKLSTFPVPHPFLHVTSPHDPLVETRVAA